VIETMPREIAPDDVRRTLDALTRRNMTVVIFDDFDRLPCGNTTVLMADTIKTLSNHGVDATILLIGVADSVDHLVQEHHSIDRALVQVHLPGKSATRPSRAATAPAAAVRIDAWPPIPAP